MNKSNIDQSKKKTYTTKIGFFLKTPKASEQKFNLESWKRLKTATTRHSLVDRFAEVRLQVRLRVRLRVGLGHVLVAGVLAAELLEANWAHSFAVVEILGTREHQIRFQPSN